MFWEKNWIEYWIECFLASIDIQYLLPRATSPYSWTDRQQNRNCISLSCIIKFHKLCWDSVAKNCILNAYLKVSWDALSCFQFLELRGDWGFFKYTWSPRVKWRKQKVQKYKSTNTIAGFLLIWIEQGIGRSDRWVMGERGRLGQLGIGSCAPVTDHI